MPRPIAAIGCPSSRLVSKSASFWWPYAYPGRWPGQSVVGSQIVGFLAGRSITNHADLLRAALVRKAFFWRQAARPPTIDSRYPRSRNHVARGQRQAVNNPAAALPWVGHARSHKTPSGARRASPVTLESHHHLHVRQRSDQRHRGRRHYHRHRHRPLRVRCRWP